MLAFLPFIPALSAGFVNWDDDVNFLNNPHYRGFSPENLRWMFTDYTGHYIPLTWLTLASDYVLWGMEPSGYHRTSLLLHSFNAALCFLVLAALLRRARPEAAGPWPDLAAAGGALFFSLHPLRAESVAWVTERRDLVSGAFFLLAILAYVKAPDGGPARTRRLAIVALLFLASLLGKATGMMLPFALLVLDVYPLKRLPPGIAFGPALRTLALEKLPLFALSAAAVVATRITQEQAGAMITGPAYPPIQSLLGPGHRILFYLAKTAAPWDLGPMYYYRSQVTALHLAGTPFVMGTTWFLWRMRRPWPAALAAWFGFAALLAPVSGVFQAGLHFAADRYTYLPSLALAALAAGTLLRWLPARPRVAAPMALLVLAALGAITCRQTGFWKDSITLWNRSLALDPECPLPYMNRGTARLDQGDLRGALADYTRCLELDPAHAKAWSSRGLLRDRLGDPDGARDDFDRAVAANPMYIQGLINRGDFRKRTGDLAGALSDAEDAIRRAPNSGLAYALRGSIRRAQGDSEGALRELDRAVVLSPLSVEVLNNRAVIHMQARRFREAFGDYDRALALKPGNPPVLVGRAQARLLLGDKRGAAADLDSALRAAPAGWPLRADVEQMLRQVTTDPK